jgi:ubiquinone/menaquinone biosynthesis C-methylase UbiE
MKKDPYRLMASFYDQLVEPFNTSLRKIGYKITPQMENRRILEIGCGTGTNLNHYRESGNDVYGIDLSPSMLKAAQANLGENAHLLLGDASLLPYSTDSFDLVIAMLTLHEMPGSIRLPVITEISRVLKDKGYLLLIDFHPGSIQFPKGWFYKTVILFFEIMAGRNHFRNFRDFIKNQGLTPLISLPTLIVEKQKIVGGGNMALVLIRKDQ